MGAGTCVSSAIISFRYVLKDIAKLPPIALIRLNILFEEGSPMDQ